MTFRWRPAAALALVVLLLPFWYPAAQAAGDPARAAFVSKWPAQEAAGQDPAKPVTTRWALLIGINDQMGRVEDNVGSRQDAEDLRHYLLKQGWQDDHILLITDRNATQANILQGIDWLARKTNGSSVAVFHYSGHSKKWYGQDADGDAEIPDEGLWPTDDRFISDRHLVQRLAAVNAGAFWINFSTCDALGFNDPGLERAGRLLTFSSREAQKSYEDPSKKNSVWGWFMLDQALLQGKADTTRDRLVTVEEAFHWANPRATEWTAGQDRGSQQPFIIDHLPGDFRLDIPPPPPAPAEDKSEDAKKDEGKKKRKTCVFGICI